jgi:hypothetical protein
MIEYGKGVATRLASGGGSVRGFGQLATPPEPPDEELAAGITPSSIDPRDDIRWSILMLVLAGLTAYLLIASRRRTPKVATSGVNAWLAGLQADIDEQRTGRHR